MLAVGEQIGGYTVVRLIGKGGMSEVYLGQHRRVARRAAIKVLAPELSRKAAIVDRFFSEARATSLIHHPGIVEVVDCDVHDGRAYIVMELLEGENLGEYLQRAGTLSRDLGLVLGVGVNVARAVGAAHELKVATIVHRDLKPDNIFLHAPGAGRPVIVKVLDFGIAKLAEQGGVSHTSTSVLMGTPSYMSPEQCRGAKAVDARSDIYSLGCVLYQALAGTPPFVREGVGDLIIAHVSEAPIPLAQRVPSLPTRLGLAVGRMIAKRPEERPQSMSAVVDELLAVAAGLGLTIREWVEPVVPVQRPLELARDTLVMPTSAEPAGAATEPRFVAGGTQLMPEGDGDSVVAAPAGNKPTTLGSAAQEMAPDAGLGSRKSKRESLRLGPAGVSAVAIALLAVLALVVRGGGRSSPPSGRPTSPGARTPLRTPPAALDPPARANPVAAPDMITIVLAGVPPGSAVVLDGLSSALPLRVARGPEVHRIIVRASAGRERVLEVDGSADRTLDVGPLDAQIIDPMPAHGSTRHRSQSTRATTRAAPTAAGAPPASEPPIDSTAPPPTTPAPKNRPRSGVAGPSAITDI